MVVCTSCPIQTPSREIHGGAMYDVSPSSSYLSALPCCSSDDDVKSAERGSHGTADAEQSEKESGFRARSSEKPTVSHTDVPGDTSVDIPGFSSVGCLHNCVFFFLNCIFLGLRFFHKRRDREQREHAIEKDKRTVTNSEATQPKPGDGRVSVGVWCGVSGPAGPLSSNGT